MQRALGDEVDWSCEESCKLVFEVVDREAELSVRREDVEEVDVTPVGFLATGEGTEDRQLGDPVSLAQSSEARRVHGVPVDDDRCRGVHVAIVAPDRWLVVSVASVAASTVVLDIGSRAMPTQAAGDGGDELTDLVGRLAEGTPRDLVLRAAKRYEDVARSVRLASASPVDRASVLRAEVDRGLRTRRYLDSWESSAWAHDGAPVVDALAEAVADGSTQELVILLERAAGHVVKVILRADDSDGMIGDLAHQVLQLHATACDSGAADPVKLARWMVRFSFDDQDFFFVDPVRYERALGDKGLAAYRREVAKRVETGADGFAVTQARERLAVLDRDLALIVELIGGDLTTRTASSA